MSRATSRSARLRRALSLVAATAALLVTVACGGDGDKAGGASGQEPSGVRGGRATIAFPADSRALDPFSSTLVNVVDVTRLQAIYDVLAYNDPVSGEVRLQTAQSLEPDPTGTVWTLTLKPGIRFSDGTPYDAEAVRYTWALHADPATRSFQAAAAVGLRMEVTGPLTLKVTLPAPNANFDRTVAHWLPFVGSPTALRADPRGFAERPVGAGPFVLKEWVRGDHQTLERNPGYWQEGLPHLDGLTFKVINDPAQVTNSIAGGQVDLAPVTQAIHARRAQEKGLKTDQVALGGGQMVAFNVTRPPFDDVRARRALTLALDAEALNRTLFEGVSRPPVGILPQGSPMLDASVRPVPPDAAEAQRLFDELAAEGRPVRFSYLVPANPSASRTAEYVQAQLGRFRNVSVQLDAVEIGAFTVKGQQQRDFQAMLFSVWAEDLDPLLHSRLHSASPQNFLGYRSPAADRALDAGRMTRDPELRRQAYSDLTRVLQDEVPFWTYIESSVTAVRHERITGVTMGNDGMFLTERLARTGK